MPVKLPHCNTISLISSFSVLASQNMSRRRKSIRVECFLNKVDKRVGTLEDVVSDGRQGALGICGSRFAVLGVIIQIKRLRLQLCQSDPKCGGSYYHLGPKLIKGILRMHEAISKLSDSPQQSFSLC
jgi:hypothetical protein